MSPNRNRAGAVVLALFAAATTMTAGSSAMLLAAGLVWAYGTLNVFRIVVGHPARRRIEDSSGDEAAP